MSAERLSQSQLLAELAGYGSDEPLRVTQVARALGISNETAYREVRSGRLPSYRVGTGRGTIRIPRADFRAYLDARKLKYTPQDLEDNRVAIERQLSEEIARQAFGEAEARRRSVAWDPQVKKALELVPRAEQLLRDPQQFVAQRAAELGASRPQAH